MIPRRKAEIARSVSRVVASDLLREESVAERIAGPEVRRAFEGLTQELAERYLGREYGSLREILGSEGTGGAERALEASGLEIARLLQDWFASPAGEGIPPEDLPYVFERFYRADAARAADTGGSGIGLAIVARIVEDHGGAVFARNGSHGGAVVGFTLPARTLARDGADVAADSAR